jgi:hypothetical protein
MWIYNRCLSLGSGIFTAKVKDLKFVVEMPSGKVLTPFNDKQLLFVKLNSSLFTWIDEQKSEKPQEPIDEQVEAQLVAKIEDKHEENFLSILKDDASMASKKSKKSVGKK